MLTAFTRAFKTPDLRRKLLFTLAIVIIFRLGSHVPVPGVSYKAVQACIKGAVRAGEPVKVLGSGDISVAVDVSAHAFSASAKEKIAAAGGSTTEL